MVVLNKTEIVEYSPHSMSISYVDQSLPGSPTVNEIVTIGKGERKEKSRALKKPVVTAPRQISASNLKIRR